MSETIFRQFMLNVRQERKLSAKELALSLGISAPYLFAIEQGDRKIPHWFHEKVSDILSLSSKERLKLKESINFANGDDYFYQEAKKRLTYDLNQLFTRIKSDNYEREVTKNMVTTLNEIRRRQQKAKAAW